MRASSSSPSSNAALSQSMVSWNLMLSPQLVEASVLPLSSCAHQSCLSSDHYRYFIRTAYELRRQHGSSPPRLSSYQRVDLLCYSFGLGPLLVGRAEPG